MGGLRYLEELGQGPKENDATTRTQKETDVPNKKESVKFAGQ